MCLKIFSLNPFTNKLIKILKVVCIMGHMFVYALASSCANCWDKITAAIQTIILIINIFQIKRLLNNKKIMLLVCVDTWGLSNVEET